MRPRDVSRKAPAGSIGHLSPMNSKRTVLVLGSGWFHRTSLQRWAGRRLVNFVPKENQEPNSVALKENEEPFRMG